MSSTVFRVSLAALALAGVVVACDSGDSKSDANRSAPNSADTSEAPPAGGAFSSSDASMSTSEKTLHASPLCGFIEGSTCFPDDDEATSIAAATLDPHACQPTKDQLPAEDAGEDAGTATVACRVRANKASESDGAASYAPSCEPAARSGTDGVACKESRDCAPGFDCVTGEKGNTCRRYCCSGSCEQQTSQNAGSTFCDIQTLAGQSNHKAPVCIPLKSCKLFAAGDCGLNETCAVVTEAGRTGCVARGSAKVDEPCDEEHCEAGLTCLGSPGERRCYKLCRIDGKDCATGQTCTPGSIFHDMAFGVCQAE